MNKKRLLLFALLTCYFAAAGFAAYMIVSNVVHFEVPVETPPPPPPEPLEKPIQIDVYNFPSPIVIGETYTFTTRTRNMDANYAVEGLTTVIALRFKSINGEWLPLSPNMFYIYYEDPNWEGPIHQLFNWNGTALVCTALGGGTWNAPIGYDVTAQITFRIEADSGLPAGTLIFDLYVTKQTP